jgi:hypothetical protein
MVVMVEVALLGSVEVDVDLVQMKRVSIAGHIIPATRLG